LGCAPGVDQSQQTAQLVSIDCRVAQDSGQRAALELAVKRHDKRDGTIRVPETDWLPR